MKIKVVKIIGKKAFLIKKGELNSNTELYINGKLIPNELKKIGLTFNESDIIEFLPSQKTLLGYEKGNIFMSVEEYNSKPRYYDEDTSDEDVLIRIANKKELEGFIPKYKDKELEKAEIEVYGTIEETNSNFIFCSVTSQWDKSPVIYNLNVNEVTLDEFNNLKNKYNSHATFENSESNYLRFAKINNNYAFNDCYPFTESRNEKIFLSLDEATKEEYKIRESVRKLALIKIYFTEY